MVQEIQRSICKIVGVTRRGNILVYSKLYRVARGARWIFHDTSLARELPQKCLSKMSVLNGKTKITILHIYMQPRKPHPTF